MQQETNAIQVLVATRTGQGMRASDFCWASEGELVTFTMACDCSDASDIDGECGCRRAMRGLSSMRATTTFMVGMLAGGEQALREALTADWRKTGWAEIMGTQELARLVENELQDLLWIASYFPLGTVLERRGERFYNRVPGASGALPPTSNVCLLEAWQLSARPVLSVF